MSETPTEPNSEEDQKLLRFGCAACGIRQGPFQRVTVDCPACKTTHVDMCCASCAAEMEQSQ